MTHKDWENEINELLPSELTERENSLKKLLNWPLFKKAYDGYGLTIVLSILNREQQKRQQGENHGKQRQSNDRTVRKALG